MQTATLNLVLKYRKFVHNKKHQILHSQRLLLLSKWSDSSQWRLGGVQRKQYSRAGVRPIVSCSCGCWGNTKRRTTTNDHARPANGARPPSSVLLLSCFTLFLCCIRFSLPHKNCSGHALDSHYPKFMHAVWQKESRTHMVPSTDGKLHVTGPKNVT